MYVYDMNKCWLSPCAHSDIICFFNSRGMLCFRPGFRLSGHVEAALLVELVCAAWQDSRKYLI